VADIGRANEPAEVAITPGFATLLPLLEEGVAMAELRSAAGESVVPSGLREIESIVRRVRPDLVRVLRQFRIPPEDARDLIQNVYLAYLQHREEVRSPEAWMVTALRRQCLHHLRDERRRLYEAVDDALLDLAACPDACPQERESLLAALARKISELGARCRELLRLRYGLGFDRFEAARELGVRPSSVGTLERRCIAELSERVLAAEGGGR